MVWQVCAGQVVAADDDVVGVQRLRDAESGGAGGAEVGREAEVVEGEAAVVAGDGRKPAELRRWLRVSGKESPIQSRLGWPERLSKGRTRTTRPGAFGGGDCAWAAREGVDEEGVAATR